MIVFNGDAELLSAVEIGKKVLGIVNDERVKEMIGEDLKVTAKQHKKMLHATDELIRTAQLQPSEVTPHSIEGFKAGLAYGMGVMFKFNQDYDPHNNVADQAIEKTKSLALLFMAMDSVLKKWGDDHYLDELLKNAKIADVPKKKITKKSKKMHD